MHDELTKKDIEKMEAEIEHRKLVVRKEALEDVKEARAQGDLSENFEYKAAKKFKNENESRIRYLEKMIKTAVIVSEDSPEDEVGMNNTVDIYFEEDDVTETYKLVTTVRSNSLKNLIAPGSCGVTLSLTCPYCPLPPDCLEYLYSTSTGLVIVSL